MTVHCAETTLVWVASRDASLACASKSFIVKSSSLYVPKCFQYDWTRLPDVEAKKVICNLLKTATTLPFQYLLDEGDVDSRIECDRDVDQEELGGQGALPERVNSKVFLAGECLGHTDPHLFQKQAKHGGGYASQQIMSSARILLGKHKTRRQQCDREQEVANGDTTVDKPVACFAAL